MDAPPEGRLTKRTRRQLVVFAVACTVVSWGLWLVAAAVGGDMTTSPAIWWFALGASGPSLAALIAFASLRDGSVPRTRVRAPWLWLPLSLVLGALPAVASALVLDPRTFGDHAGDVLAASGGLLLFTVTYLIAGPLAEEFGWRGYLQPRVRLAWGPIGTSVVAGSAWAVWHLPLFFLPGTGQQAMGLFTLRGLLFLVAMIPLSMTFLLLSERLGGAVWSAILIHFAGNAAGALLPQTSDAAAFVQLAVTTVIAGGAYLVWRRGSARLAARPVSSRS